MKNQAYNCQRCGSDNTSSFQMIYQSGTQSGNFKALSYGLGTGAIGAAGKTNSQSLLSQQTTPPPMPKLTGSDFIFACIAGIALIVLTQTFLDVIGYDALPILTIICFIVGFSGLYFFRNEYIKKKKVIWKGDMQKWRNSWMCLKCGNIWLLQQSK